MATTYANVTVVGADHAAVVEALGPGPALVTDAVGGMTVVFSAADEEAARFGEGLTAAALSAACGCAALARRALSPDEAIGGAPERHAWLVEALDLPRCAAGWGYRYLAAWPEGFDGGPLTAVGADPQEEP